jgi:hypothetical protein
MFKYCADIIFEEYKGIDSMTIPDTIILNSISWQKFKINNDVDDELEGEINSYWIGLEFVDVYEKNIKNKDYCINESTKQLLPMHKENSDYEKKKELYLRLKKIIMNMDYDIFLIESHILIYFDKNNYYIYNYLICDNEIKLLLQYLRDTALKLDNKFRIIYNKCYEYKKFFYEYDICFKQTINMKKPHYIGKDAYMTQTPFYSGNQIY